MAELITGRGGTDHVDSEDFGAFNVVTLGDGTYILSGCSMVMKTATTLHIAAGELLMQGRHVRIKGAGEDVDDFPDWDGQAAEADGQHPHGQRKQKESQAEEKAPCHALRRAAGGRLVHRRAPLSVF